MTRAGAGAASGLGRGGQRVRRAAGAHGLSGLPQSLDPQRDDVAVVQPAGERFQRRRAEVLDERAGGHGAGADDVAGAERHAARDVGDDFAEGPVHLGGRPRTDHGVVDQGGHLQVELAVAAVRLELVGRDQVRAQRDSAVLALALPDRELALQLLQVSRGPVVEDGVADDGPFGLLDRQGPCRCCR